MNYDERKAALVSAVMPGKNPDDYTLDRFIMTSDLIEVAPVNGYRQVEVGPGCAYFFVLRDKNGPRGIPCTDCVDEIIKTLKEGPKW